jgi:hypothetical protein
MEKCGEGKISVTTSGDTGRDVHWKRGRVEFITVLDVEAKRHIFVCQRIELQTTVTLPTEMFWLRS